MQKGSFKECFTGCVGVIHTATPIRFGKDVDGEKDIYTPAMTGLHDVMNTAVEVGTIKTFIYTSSMAACAPKPEPEVKSEECWSDHEK